jgi:plastocyanin
MKRCWILHSVLVTILAFAAAPAMGGTVKGKASCGALCGNFVIYVEAVPGEWSGTGEEVVVLDQRNKVFIPHVMAILKGTAVRLKNSDAELHNVHAYLKKETVFNIGMLPDLSFDVKKFKEPGRYVMLCDRHAEMSAYIVVLENPFFTQPDADGHYEIRDVPAGTYTLVKYDPEEKEVTKKNVVLGNDVVEADF